MLTQLHVSIHKPGDVLSWCMFHTSVAEVDLIGVCHRYWVNPEQCAVYQQQCCEHHGYWN